MLTVGRKQVHQRVEYAEHCENAIIGGAFPESLCVTREGVALSMRFGSGRIALAARINQARDDPQ